SHSVSYRIWRPTRRKPPLHPLSLPGAGHCEFQPPRHAAAGAHHPRAALSGNQMGLLGVVWHHGEAVTRRVALRRTTGGRHDSESRLHVGRAIGRGTGRGTRVLYLKRCTKSSSNLRFYEETMCCRLDAAPEPLSPGATYRSSPCCIA